VAEQQEDICNTGPGNLYKAMEWRGRVSIGRRKREERGGARGERRWSRWRRNEHLTIR